MLTILLGLAMLWTLHASPSGRALRRWLVERPAAWLSRVTGAQLAVLLLSLAIIVVAVQVFEGDGEAVRLVGSSVLETATWFIAFDIGTWLEVYAVLWLLGASRQARAALDIVRSLVTGAWQASLRLRRPRTRQSSGGVRRRPPPGRKDAEPEPWVWVGVAA